MTKQFRQGDVLLIQVSGVKKGLKVIERDKLTLALGEATGHSHTITLDKAELLEDVETLERWATLPGESELLHQEHAPIALPPGNYKVVRQTEYTPLGLRNVAD